MSMAGWCMAESTASGTFVGPGIARISRPWATVMEVVSALSDLDPEEPGRRPAEDRGALGVAEPRRGEDEIDRRRRPRIREVGADQELAGADLGDEVAHALGVEDHRVVVELLQVLRGLLLDRAVRAARAEIGPGRAAEVRAPGVRGQEAAGVRADDREPRE